MKLKDFKKLFKNCSLLKEEGGQDILDPTNSASASTLDNPSKDPSTDVGDHDEIDDDATQKAALATEDEFYTGYKDSDWPEYLESNRNFLMRFWRYADPSDGGRGLFIMFEEVISSVIRKMGSKKQNKSDPITKREFADLQRALGVGKDGILGPVSFAAIGLVYAFSSESLEENKTVIKKLFESSNSKGFRHNISEILNTHMLNEVSQADLSTMRTANKKVVSHYVTNVAAGEEVSKALKKLKRKKISVSTPPGLNLKRKYQKDESWKEDKEFLRGIIKLSDKYVVDPEDVLAAMAIETIGTFSQKSESHAGCTGLIQFCKKSRKMLGVTKSSLKKMTRVEQLKYTDKYFAYWGLQNWKNYFPNEQTMPAGNFYLCIFLPWFRFLPSDYVVLAKTKEQLEGQTPAHRFISKAIEGGSWSRHNPNARGKADTAKVSDFAAKLQEQKEIHDFSEVLSKVR